MSYRDLANIEVKIFHACFDISTRGGVEAISAQKIAKICGISTFAIFSRFKTIRGVVDAAKEYLSQCITDDLLLNLKKHPDLLDIWDISMQRVIENPTQAIFMVSYIVTYGFVAAKSNPNSYKFMPAVKALFANFKFEDEGAELLAWDFLSSNIFYYAQKFIRGEIPDTLLNRKRVKELVFIGMDRKLSAKE